MDFVTSWECLGYLWLSLRSYTETTSRSFATRLRRSQLWRKKSNAIAFHFVREGCAHDQWRTVYINTHFNVAYLMTKPLAGIKRWKFVQMLQHYTCPAESAYLYEGVCILEADLGRDALDDSRDVSQGLEYGSNAQSHLNKVRHWMYSFIYF